MTLDNIEQELSTLLNNRELDLAVRAERVTELYDLLQERRIAEGLGPCYPSIDILRYLVIHALNHGVL